MTDVTVSMRWVQPGQCEVQKAGVHAALGGLAAVCCLYNACAFVFRQQPRLAANAIIYAAITYLEIQQVERHRDGRVTRSRSLSFPA